MAEIVSFCWIGMELVCAYFFCECFLQRKRWTKYTCAIILLMLAVIYLYSSHPIGMIPPMLLTPVVYFVVSLVCYDGLWQRRVMAVVICVVLLAVVDAGIMYSCSGLLQISTAAFLQRRYTYIFAGTVSKASSVLLAWTVCRIFAKNTDKRLQIRWLAVILVFPAVSYVLLVILFLHYRYESDMSLRAIGITLLIGFLNIGMMCLIEQIEKSEKAAQRAALLDQQIDIQTQSFLSLEKSYRAQRAASHDYLHHLNAIGALLEKEQYGTAAQYIQELKKQHTARVFAVDSHHPVVDAILNQKYQLAREVGIDMQITVNDLSPLDLPTEKLVVVLSNLLDNAIEACERSKGERAIRISIVLQDKLLLSIKNTSAPVSFIGGRPVTTKADKDKHGYGLLNVTHILDGLGSEYAFHYQDGWFSFVSETPVHPFDSAGR